MGYVYKEPGYIGTARGTQLVADMEVTALEKIFSKDSQIRNERDSLVIIRFNSKHNSLNNKNLSCGTALT